ncbi:MAG TPA: hydrolase [Candidatus Paceibacterota bacterium]|nr:hydrolase [Candidatus Paceibacterota bacterium]
MTVFKPDLDMLAFRLKLGGSRIKKRAFLSTGNEENKQQMLSGARALAELGVEIFATRGTSTFLKKHGVENIGVNKIAQDSEPNVLPMLEAGMFDLVINVPTGDSNYDEVSDARIMRQLAIEHGVPLITDVTIAVGTINRMIDEIKRHRAQVRRPSMREYFAGLVHDRGGYADNHGHYDKAYLITPDTLEIGGMPMEEKWRLYRKLKENYTHENLIERITRCVEFRMSQGVNYMRTMVDADTLVELKCIEAALEVKRRFAGKAVIEIGIQPLEGVLEPGPRKWVEKACGMADFIGGLPSRDNPRPEAHLDFILGMAREMGKRVDVHVDQKGVPWEQETKLLALKTIEYGLEGRTAGVHSIISRQPLYQQRETAKMTTAAGMAIVSCPGADVSMEQLDMQVQMSNSIPPIGLYQEEGTKVVYGSDNTEDPFMPFSDGDPWIEARFLMDACRTYTASQIADIMCDKSLFETQLLAQAA